MSYRDDEDRNRNQGREYDSGGGHQQDHRSAGSGYSSPEGQHNRQYQAQADNDRYASQRDSSANQYRSGGGRGGESQFGGYGRSDSDDRGGNYGGRSGGGYGGGQQYQQDRYSQGGQQQGSDWGGARQSGAGYGGYGSSDRFSEGYGGSQYSGSQGGGAGQYGSGRQDRFGGGFYGDSDRFSSGGHQSQQGHDPDYHQWRNEQISSLDKDYETYRGERYQKFSDDFNTWRSNRTKNADQNQQTASAKNKDQTK